MPEAFLHLSEQDRNEILQTAATRLGQQASVLEKDVWVCWALQALFSIPNAHPMAFKGDTSYPSAVEINSGYLQSSILIEFGGRNVIDPNQRHGVSPYIAELVSGLELPAAEVVVLSPERTFWEKATLIHVACNTRESRVLRQIITPKSA